MGSGDGCSHPEGVDNMGVLRGYTDHAEPLENNPKDEEVRESKHKND
jgi:hypothetical protein